MIELLNISAWIALGVAAFFAVVGIVYGLRPLRKTAGLSNPELPWTEEERPKASVVIYSSADEEALLSCIARVMDQNYPDFEVIVVCDAGAEYSGMLADRVAAIYPQVYITFVPPGSHNLSRRKLATTIGVKAATGDVIVTTISNVEIPSDNWLAALMAPFCGSQGKYYDLSLGVSMMDFSELTGAGKWYRQFVGVLMNSSWIGYAAMGHPYRGDGFNLAFRRSVFFEHKGYAKTINIHNGDDDLFVKEITTGANTRVTLSPQDLLKTYWGDSANRVWTMRKEGYDFTSRWLPRAPFIRMRIQNAAQWLVLLGSAYAALAAWPSIIPLILAGVILLVFWAFEISAYRHAAARLDAVKLWWAVVPFWLWLPIGNAIFKFRHRNTRIKNFTWQRRRK